MSIVMAALLWVLAAVPAAADESDYDYPLDDPLAATVVGTPGDYRAALPPAIPLRERSLPPLVERPAPAVLSYARPLRYGLAAQDGPAPLVFLLAGTGGAHDGATNRILARVFYDAGLHVVTLPSTTTVTFLLNASTHPVPGRMSADVADVYRLMRAIDAQVSPELEITGYRLAGYSLGGTQAAFLAHRDKEIGAFDFQRVLLVNPAVDVYASAERLDAMLMEGLPRGIAGLPAFIERTMGQLERLYGGGQPLRFDEDALYRAYLSARPDRGNLASLIGLAFRLALANMAFAADLVTDTGAIVPPADDPGVGDSLESYLVRAFEMSFAAYVDQLLVPYYRQRSGEPVSRESLLAEGNLARIGGYLGGAAHIGVVSNRDEPILDKDELAFLRATFGERAFIYPRGGHLGNIAQHQTVRDMQRFMGP